MYIHYSNIPLLEIYSVYKQEPNYKPVGLWISVDDAWKNWCKDQDFHTEDLKYENIIRLNLDKILFLRDNQDILEFTQKYKQSLCDDLIRLIRWDEVAKLYNGIIISPYVHSLAMSRDALWYFGWDVASGCIWNKKSIKNINLNNAI